MLWLYGGKVSAAVELICSRNLISFVAVSWDVPGNRGEQTNKANKRAEKKRTGKNMAQR